MRHNHIIHQFDAFAFFDGDSGGRELQIAHMDGIWLSGLVGFAARAGVTATGNDQEGKRTQAQQNSDEFFLHSIEIDLHIVLINSSAYLAVFVQR